MEGKSVVEKVRQVKACLCTAQYKDTGFSVGFFFMNYCIQVEFFSHRSLVNTP